MVDDQLSTAQDCVVPLSQLSMQIDRWDLIAFATGGLLAAIFFAYFNRCYGR